MHRIVCYFPLGIIDGKFSHNVIFGSPAGKQLHFLLLGTFDGCYPCYYASIIPVCPVILVRGGDVLSSVWREEVGTGNCKQQPNAKTTAEE